jgi:nicotinamidase-related amidase
MSKLDLLTPQNHAIALIDFQPAMYQGIQSHDRLVPFNNAQVLAKAAKLFGVPTVISTVAADLLRPVHAGGDGAVSGTSDHRPHIDQLLARPPLSRGGSSHGPQEDRRCRAVD